MNEDSKRNVQTREPADMPILQLNRLNYVKTSGRILESTHAKLEQYIAYATDRLATEVTSGDVIEHGLKLLFDRDAGFRDWLRTNKK